MAEAPRLGTIYGTPKISPSDTAMCLLRLGGMLEYYYYCCSADSSSSKVPLRMTFNVEDGFPSVLHGGMSNTTHATQVKSHFDDMSANFG